MRLLLPVLAGALSATGCAYFDHEPKPHRPPVYYTAPELATGASVVDTGQHLYRRDRAYCHDNDGRGRGRAPT